MEAVLQIQQARKRFGETTALDGADLEVRPGEWLGLLGPNGAGKTTLIRAIAGRVRLDGGRVVLFGTPLDGAAAAPGGGRARAAARRPLGIVPQEIALYPTLTARENLEIFGAMHGLRGRDLQDRVAWGLDWTGLADRARDRVKGFSGGMKRRLNLAAGVMHRPSVVLLDEPTAGVDPQSRERLWEMLAQLRGEGASLLLTTHQLDEAERVCQRIVIIDHGRAIAAGTLQELIDQTIGRRRQVVLTLGAQSGRARASPRFQITDGTARCAVDDVARELPALLAEIGAAGYTVLDLRIEAPSLHAVFLHLTGRELRE